MQRYRFCNYGHSLLIKQHSVIKGLTVLIKRKLKYFITSSFLTPAVDIQLCTYGLLQQQISKRTDLLSLSLCNKMTNLAQNAGIVVYLHYNGIVLTWLLQLNYNNIKYKINILHNIAIKLTASIHTLFIQKNVPMYCPLDVFPCGLGGPRSKQILLDIYCT